MTARKKTTTSRTKKVTRRSEPINLGLFSKFKAEHGIALGAGLILLKGILGISILIGLIILILSTVKYTANHLGKR